MNTLSVFEWYRQYEVWSRNYRLFIFKNFIHVYNHIYDFSWIVIDQLFDGSISYILAGWFVLLAYLGGWIGYFILISATVNTYGLYARVKMGKGESVAIKQIKVGFLVVIAGYFTEALGYYGYIGNVLRTEGDLSLETWGDQTYLMRLWSRVFMVEALQIIGWGLVLTGLVHYLLVRNKEKITSQNIKNNIYWYLLLAILVTILTPLVWNMVDNMAWLAPSAGEIDAYGLGDVEYHQSWPSEFLQAKNASLLTYVMVLLAGDLYPIFPYIMIFMLGSALGAALADENLRQKVPRWGGLSLLVILAFGIIFAMIFGFGVTFERPSMAYFFFLLLGEASLLMLFLTQIEFKGRAERFRSFGITRYFSTWGLIALSVFALQIWSLVPRFILNPFFDSDLRYERFAKGQEMWVLLFAFLTILAYDALIWIWARTHFKFSIEWIIIRLSRKKGSVLSTRLDPKVLRKGPPYSGFEIRDSENEAISVPAIALTSKDT